MLLTALILAIASSSDSTDLAKELIIIKLQNDIAIAKATSDSIASASQKQRIALNKKADSSLFSSINSAIATTSAAFSSIASKGKDTAWNASALMDSISISCANKFADSIDGQMKRGKIKDTFIINDLEFFNKVAISKYMLASLDDWRRIKASPNDRGNTEEMGIVPVAASIAIEAIPEIGKLTIAAINAFKPETHFGATSSIQSDSAVLLALSNRINIIDPRFSTPNLENLYRYLRSLDSLALEVSVDSALNAKSMNSKEESAVKPKPATKTSKAESLKIIKDDSLKKADSLKRDSILTKKHSINLQLLNAFGKSPEERYSKMYNIVKYATFDSLIHFKTLDISSHITIQSYIRKHWYNSGNYYYYGTGRVVAKTTSESGVIKSYIFPVDLGKNEFND